MTPSRRDAEFTEFVAARQVHVRRIIVRADIDEHRRPWRRERVGLDGHDGPARAPLPVEERSALFEALQALPPMQRRAVVLRHWLGLSVEETAAELGISDGTVKSHTSRGMTALRAALVAAAPGAQVDQTGQ